MSDVFIAYDTRSGQIVAVHSGPADASYRWSHQYGADEHCAVIRTRAFECSPDVRYKIDLCDKTLVACAPDEHGVTFSFGRTGNTP